MTSWTKWLLKSPATSLTKGPAKEDVPQHGQHGDPASTSGAVGLDQLQMYAESVWAQLKARTCLPTSPGQNKGKRSGHGGSDRAPQAATWKIKVALLNSLLPLELADACPAAFDLSPASRLEDLRLLIARHTSGALLAGRVFRASVGSKHPVALSETSSLGEQGVVPGELLYIEAQAVDSIRAAVWALRPPVFQAHPAAAPATEAPAPSPAAAGATAPPAQQAPLPSDVSPLHIHTSSKAGAASPVKQRVSARVAPAPAGPDAAARPQPETAAAGAQALDSPTRDHPSSRADRQQFAAEQQQQQQTKKRAKSSGGAKHGNGEQAKAAELEEAPAQRSERSRRQHLEFGTAAEAGEEAALACAPPAGATTALNDQSVVSELPQRKRKQIQNQELPKMGGSQAPAQEQQPQQGGQPPACRRGFGFNFAPSPLLPNRPLEGHQAQEKPGSPPIRGASAKAAQPAAPTFGIPAASPESQQGQPPAEEAPQELSHAAALARQEAALGSPVGKRKRTSWDAHLNLALLDGVRRYYMTDSKEQCHDCWARILREHPGMPVDKSTQVKDRFVTLMKAASRGFSDVRDPSYSVEVRALAVEIYEAVWST